MAAPDPHVNPASGVWDDNYYAQTQGGGGNSGGGLSSPGNSQQTQQYLNDYHDLVKTAADAFNTPSLSDAEIMGNVKSSLLPNTPVPQAPNMTQEFQTLRADPSITNLETKLASLKASANTIQTQNQTNQAAEEGKPVAQNVIAGRQSQEQKEATIQLDSVNLQMATVTDELNMRYTMVDNIMKFTQSDYDNAMKNYTTQFSTNQAIYDAFNTAKQEQFTNKMDELKTVMTGTATEIDSSIKIQAQQWQEQQDVIKNASANLGIMANMITSGNLTYNNLSADQKVFVQKMEIQAGMPAGTLQNIVDTNPTGKLIYAGANGAVIENADGTFKTESYNVSGKNNGTPAPGSPADIKNHTAQLNLDNKAAPGMLASDVTNGMNLNQALKIYGPNMTGQKILTIYNQNSPYGAAKETPEQLQKMIAPYQAPTKPKTSTTLNYGQ